jgi:gluconate 5-dehydrogenase
MNLFSLKGRRALITGSGRGLGLRFAEGLAEAGAEVVINDVEAARAETAAAALRAKGHTAHTASFNVTDPGRRARWRATAGAIRRPGGHPRQQRRHPPLRRAARARMSPSGGRCIDVNLSGAFLVAQAVAAGMVARRRGKIINICSLMSEGGRPTTGNYMAAKGGLKMLTKAMTVEWAKHNIQANGIGPGYILSDMTAHLAEKPDFDAWVKMRTPAGRWGTPDDLVGAAVFLSSPASDFVNGQIIYVDGGWLAAL